MPEVTEEVTNPEGAAATEEEVDTTTTEEENEEETEVVEETEEEEDPRDAIIAKLEEEKKRLYDKLKSGYKKHAQNKNTTLPKEEVKKMMEEIYKEESQEKQLVETYEDAKELLPEIKKLQKEKWFDIDTAYDVVKWKMLRDEWYRNQIIGERSKNYGTMERKETSTFKKYEHLFTVPKVSIPRKQD